MIKAIVFILVLLMGVVMRVGPHWPLWADLFWIVSVAAVAAGSSRSQEGKA